MEKAKAKLTKLDVVGYGFGGLFCYSFYLMLQAYYMMFFLTEVLQLNTYIAAGIYTATQIIKVVTMIVAGTVIDATNLKLGKYRSWLVIGAVMVTIFATLMFLKTSLPTGALVALFIASYILQSFGYNAMWTASRALVGPMAQTSDDAVALTGAAQAGTTLGGIIYGLIGTGVIAAFTATGQPYAVTALVYGLVIIAGTLVMLKVTGKFEEPTPKAGAAKGSKVSFMTMLKSLRGPMIPYFIAMTLGSAQSGFFFALLTYFTQYVLKDPKTMGYAMTVYSVTGFFGALAAKPLCAKLNKKKVYIITTACAALMYILIRYFGSTAAPFLVIYGIIGFIASFAGVLLPAFANDLADYQEMKTGQSARAFTQAVAGVTIRLAAVISTSISSFGLAAVGYKAGAEMTDKMLSSITNLMAVGPAVVCALAVIAFLFYKVDEDELDRYRADRAKKMAAAKN